MNRCALAAAAAALTLSPFAKAGSEAGKVEVVRKLRTGNNVEDITFVATGKHEAQVAAMNGWDVLAVRLEAEEVEAEEADPGELPPGAHKLFDVRNLGLGTAALHR